MRSLNYDHVNFQEPTATGHEKLLQLIKVHVKPKDVQGKDTKKKKDVENELEKKASYQVNYTYNVHVEVNRHFLNIFGVVLMP
jgi:hypothetical protein